MPASLLSKLNKIEQNGAADKYKWAAVRIQQMCRLLLRHGRQLAPRLHLWKSQLLLKGPIHP